MAGRYAAWLASDGRSDNFGSGEVCILEQYVDGALDLHDAADQLTGLPGPPTFTTILHLAQEDADAHPAFIELIKTIFEMGRPEWNEEGSKFGWQWRDTHDSKSGGCAFEFLIVLLSSSE